MKKILVLAALGVFFPTLVFAQQCQWVCDDGSGGNTLDYTSLLRLSEFLPNPVGDDTTGEFIEIENLTGKQLDLTGWKLTDASGRKFTFTEGTIQGKTFLAIYRPTSKISLNNSGGETVSLFSPDGNIQDEAEFEGSAKEGASFARGTDGWSWTTSPTPNTANDIRIPNLAPTLDVELPEQIFSNQEAAFSAADSSDDDGDTLEATWEFNDGTKLTGLVVSRIFSSGDFSVRVTVTDPNGGEDSDEFDFSVNPYDLSEEVFINELYPKPDTGQEEFIELVNQSERVVELGGWKLTDGSRTFTFPADATVLEKGFVVVYKSETSIALNDTGDNVQLIRPDESVADQETYTTAQKAKSYSRYESGWVWAMPTPGEANESQAQGSVLGVMTESNVSPVGTDIEFSEPFFQMYGVYIAGAVAAGVIGFGLFKKWKHDKEERDEYDVV